MSDDKGQVDERDLEEDIKTANFIYNLFLVAVLIWAIPSFFGFVMALTNKKGAPDWLKSHFSFQVHTFLKGALFTFVSLLTLGLWIGALGIVATVIWWVLRCIEGMRFLKQEKAIPDPGTWYYKQVLAG